MTTPFLAHHDARFRRLTIPVARLETLWKGALWAEGPVYCADARHLLFSDIPNDRLLKWDEQSGRVEVFRAPSNHANGNTRDREGRLVTCEHGTRRVTRTEPDGRITVLADRHEGRRLNSPNDVVVASDGAVWFTDPLYGILTDYEGHRAESETGTRNVYRLDASSGRLVVVADDFDMPNGLAFSPDERLLYVADSGRSHGDDKPHHVRRFAVEPNGRLTGGDVFATIEPGIPDGIRTDEDGRLWVSAGDGVQCFDPAGTHLGTVLIGEAVANICFGGPCRNRLFITATTSLYSLHVNTRGAQTP